MSKTTMWRALVALALLAAVAVAASPKARQVVSTWTPKAVADSGGALPFSTWAT